MVDTPFHLSALCVDDTPVNLRVLAEMLRACDIRSVMANGGAEALEELGQQRFDVVLLDIFMPGMDGVETLRCIRSLPGDLARIPVVAITGDTSRARSEFLACGFDGYLSKPVSLQPLLAEIMGALARAKGLPSLSRLSARG